MVDFNKLRQTRGTNSMMSALQDNLKKNETKRDNFWKPTRDAKTNVASCIVRLLPIPKADYALAEEGKVSAEDLTPMVRLLRHSFKTTSGRFYNNLSPKMRGEEDPISEWTAPQWRDLKKLGEGHPQYKPTKTDLINYFADDEYFVNLYIVEDTQAPENNGKIVKYKVPKAVRELINSAHTPKFAGDPQFDPFDPWTGAFLSMRVVYEEKNIGGKDVWSPDYTRSVWQDIGKPLGDDEMIERVWGEAASLVELYLGKIPTYEEAKSKFCELMGLDSEYNTKPKGGGSSTPSTTANFGSTPEQSKTQSLPMSQPAVQHQPSSPSSGGDDNLEELERLLNQ